MNYDEAIGHVEAIEQRRVGWEQSLKALRSLRISDVNLGLREFEKAVAGHSFGGLSPRDVELRELERVRGALGIWFER